MNCTPVSDGRRDDMNQLLPFFGQKRGKKDHQVLFANLKDERSLGCVVGQQIERKTKPGGPLDL
jgi:hypothetical protein